MPSLDQLLIAGLRGRVDDAALVSLVDVANADPVDTIPCRCGPAWAEAALGWPARWAVEVATRADTDALRILATDERAKVRHAVCTNVRLDAETAASLTAWATSRSEACLWMVCRPQSAAAILEHIDAGTIPYDAPGIAQIAADAALEIGRWGVALRWTVGDLGDGIPHSIIGSLLGRAGIGEASGTFTFPSSTQPQRRELAATLGFVTVDGTVHATLDADWVRQRADTAGVAMNVAYWLERAVTVLGRPITVDMLTAFFRARTSLPQAASETFTAALGTPGAITEDALDLLETWVTDGHLPLILEDVAAAGLRDNLTVAGAAAQMFRKANFGDGDISELWRRRPDLAERVFSEVADILDARTGSWSRPDAIVAAGAAGCSEETLVRLWSHCPAGLVSALLDPNGTVDVDTAIAVATAARPEYRNYFRHALKHSELPDETRGRAVSFVRALPEFGALVAATDGGGFGMIREVIADAFADSLLSVCADHTKFPAMAALAEELVASWDGTLDTLVHTVAGVVTSSSR